VTEREQAARAAFLEQAYWCDRLGSPFTARLCTVLAAILDRSTPAGQRVLDWPGDPDSNADAVPLRLCGGLHFLVRSGAAPELADCYPPGPLPEEKALSRGLRAALEQKDLLPWLDSPPQTNEVGRSSVLMGGLLAVADTHSLPMRLFELGASAGLNLVLDRYRYDLGGVAAGDPSSPLRLSPVWKGPPPPAAEVRIVGRRGVDLRPADPRTDAERLAAYVWPDQTQRMKQIEAALAIAAIDPAPVDRGDAGEWLENQLAVPAQAGVTRIVMHSIAYQYFSAEAQRRVHAAIEAAAHTAGEDAPLAWVRFERLPEDERPSLRLKTWPGGGDRLLAWCHPHGGALRWLA
jgi:hypothetical protein